MLESMPLDDQSMLVNLINKRIQDKRRADLVAEVRKARGAYERDEVKRGTLKRFYRQKKYAYMCLRTILSATSRLKIAAAAPGMGASSVFSLAEASAG